jgi:hypothetical protein
VLPPGVAESLADSWAYFLHLAITLVPLFIGGSFLVALAKSSFPPDRVERTLDRYDTGVGNVVAAGLGAVTPFCSCSTVPILAGLLQAGAPLGIAFSFLFASPLVNAIAVLLLAGAFGLEITAYYVASMFVAAVVGGTVVGRLVSSDYVKDVRLAEESTRPVASDGGTTDACGRGCGPECGKTRDSRSSTGLAPLASTVRRAGTEAWSFFVETLPYLLAGMVVGALIHGAVPVEILQTVLGRHNPVAVPLAALAGAPLYVSLSGMLPIAASLGDQGIAIGTVLAFVVGGAGVSVPNVILLNKLFEVRLLAVYVGTVVTISVVVGTAFNLLLV